MTARRQTLKDRREVRQAKRPRTRDVPHPFLLPVIGITMKPERKDAK